MARIKAYLIGLVIIISFAHKVIGQSSLRTMMYSSRSKQQALTWQKTLRVELFDILKLRDLVANETLIPFHQRILSTDDKGTYKLEEIEFNSTPGRRITVLLTLPSSEGIHPAVVCIHGHGGTRFSVHDTTTIYKGFARALAERGFVTIAANVGQHEVYEANRILMGERLWDLMRCVDYLQSLPQVDKSRIGCAGLSLGGEMAMWLGAMDERVVATVSAGFLTVMDQMEQNHCMCWKFDGLRELVDYADIYSLHAPDPLMCQNGRKEGPKDFYVPIARKALSEVKVVYDDFKKPDNLILDVHNGGHEIDLPALLAFFQNNL